MQHLDTHPTLDAALPASRQGRYLACALGVYSNVTRPEGRKLAE